MQELLVNKFIAYFLNGSNHNNNQTSIIVANVGQFCKSAITLSVYWQGSLLVGLVGSNVETIFNNLDVSTSDSMKESPLKFSWLFSLWPGPNAVLISPSGKIYLHQCQYDVRELRLKASLGLNSRVHQQHIVFEVCPSARLR